MNVPQSLETDPRPDVPRLTRKRKHYLRQRPSSNFSLSSLGSSLAMIILSDMSTQFNNASVATPGRRKGYDKRMDPKDIIR